MASQADYLDLLGQILREEEHEAVEGVLHEAAKLGALEPLDFEEAEQQLIPEENAALLNGPQLTPLAEGLAEDEALVPVTDPELAVEEEGADEVSAPTVYIDPTRSSAMRQQVLKQNKKSLKKINKLMSYGVFDWSITKKEANQALGILESYSDTVELLVVATELGSGKAMRRLHEHAPKGTLASHPRARLVAAEQAQDGAFIADAMRGESPLGAGDQPLIWRLFSGLRDVDYRTLVGGVADEEEIGALPVQSWLEDAPEDQQQRVQAELRLVAKSTLEESERQAAAQAEREALKAATEEELRSNPAFAADIQRIEDLLSRSLSKWTVSRKDAVKVFGLFQQMSGESEIEMAVLKLDEGPFLERFLKKLPSKERWGVGKETFLRILVAREPTKNIGFAKELLSKGLFDWRVTDEEALLAFRIVQRLPADSQRAFREKDDGKWWTRMQSNLGRNDANDRDMHFYQNDEEKTALKDGFAKVDGEWPDGKLAAQIDMLCRMGEDVFVETTLRGAGLLADPSRAWIGERYGFGPAGRDEAVYEAWLSNSAVDTRKLNFGDRVASGLSLVGNGVGLLRKSQTGIALEDIEGALAGGVAGMNFTVDRSDDPTVNVLNARRNGFSGLVVEGQTLKLLQVSTHRDGNVVQTGAITIEGLYLETVKETEAHPEGLITARISNILIDDITVITPEAMWRLGQVAVSDLAMWIDRRLSKVALNIESTMGEVMTVVESLVGMIRGDQLEPSQLAAQIENAYSDIGVGLSLGGFQATDIAGSDGSYVAAAGFEGFEMEVVNGRKGPTMRARLADLEAQPTLSDEETRERDRLLEQLSHIAALEEEEAVLAKKKPSKLTPYERERLAELRDALSLKEMSVSLEHLSASGVEMMGTSVEQVDVSAVRASVKADVSNDEHLHANVAIDASIGQVEARGITAKDGTTVDELSLDAMAASVHQEAGQTDIAMGLGRLYARQEKEIPEGIEGAAESQELILTDLNLGVQSDGQLLSGLLDGQRSLVGKEMGVAASLASLDLNDVDYAGGGFEVQAKKGRAAALIAEVTVQVGLEEDGSYRFTPIMIPQIGMGTFSLEGVHTTFSYAGETFEVGLPAMNIEGLSGTELSLDLSDMPNWTGKMSLDLFELEVSAAVGEHLSAHGEMRLKELSFDALTDKDNIELKLGDLAFESLSVTGSEEIPEGSLVSKVQGAAGEISRIAGIQGAVNLNRKTGKADFNLGMDDFTLDHLNYADGVRRIGVTGGASVKGVSIEGELELDLGLLESDPGEALKSLVFSKIGIDSVTGEGLSYREKGAGINASLKKGYIEGIVLKDLDALEQTGKVDIAKAGVDGLSLAAALAGEKGQTLIKANASASVSGVHAERMGDGVVDFGLASVSASGKGSVQADGLDVGFDMRANASGVEGKYKGGGAVEVGARRAALGGHVKGEIGDAALDLHADLSAEHLEGDRTRDGDIGASWGSMSGGLKGSALGIPFDLDFSGLSGKVSVQGNEINTVMELDLLTLNRLNFKSPALGLELQDQAQMKSALLTLGIKLNEEGVEQIVIHKVDVERIDLNKATLEKDDITIKMSKAYVRKVIAEGVEIQVAGGVSVSSGGTLNVAEVGLGALDGEKAGMHFDGKDIAAKDLEVGFLCDNQFTVDLATLTADSLGVVDGTMTAQLARLKAMGLEYHSGNDQLYIEEAEVALGASGAESQVETPEVKQGADGQRWSLPFVDQLSGHLGITIPLAGDNLVVRPVIKNGKAQVGATLDNLRLPYERYWGWAPRWLVFRMVTSVVGHIVDFFDVEALKLRQYLEQDLTRERKAVSFSTEEMGAQLVDAMGGWARAIDIMSPTGPGLLSSTKSAVGEFFHDNNPFANKDKRDARIEEREAEQHASRVDQLMDWIRQIGIDAEMSGQGDMAGFRRPKKDDDECLFFQATAALELKASGDLGGGLSIFGDLGLTNMYLSLEAMRVFAEEVDVTMHGGVGLPDDNKITGAAGGSARARGVTLTFGTAEE